MDTSRLKSLPLFESVSDEDLQKISPFVSEVSVSEGKHLVDEGDYAYTFMAIEDGTAEVRRGGEKVAELGRATSSARSACWATTAATPRWWPRRTRGCSRSTSGT